MRRKGAHMRTLYHSVYETLQRVDFPALFSGFHEFPFALYDHNTVYLPQGEIPYDNRFLGNTAIEFEGGYLAIWNVEEPQKENVTQLAASLVHEMFHAFQRTRGDKRYPYDLIGLDYPRTAEVLTTKAAEYALLNEAFHETDASKKRAALLRFIAWRKHRHVWMGDIVLQELLTETAEGMAEYVSLKALMELSEPLYRATTELHLKNLTIDAPTALDMRKLAYASGSLFLLALDGAGLSFAHEVGEEKHTVFELVSEGVAPEAPPAPQSGIVEAAHERIRAYEASIEEKLNQFRALATEKIEGEFFICGYDPMNMVKQNGKVLCSRFVMLNADGETIFINGPVLLHMKSGSHNKVTAYEAVPTKR